MDAARLSATNAAAAIRDKRLSSVDLVKSCLVWIADSDPKVCAWESLDPALVLKEAKLRDASPSTGPLHGVPVGIKDIIDTVDFPTAYGSPIYRGHRPAKDAT